MGTKSYQIAVVPGDGIGQDIVPEGLKVLEAVQQATGDFRLEFEEFPWGCDHYLEAGEVMPANGTEILRKFDAIYFGAAGHPNVPDYLPGWRLILVVRRAFEQFVNLRPVKLLPGVPCPLVGKTPADIDFVIVRENTEGEFAGPGGLVHEGHSQETAVQVSVFTRLGVERVAKYAFELARKRRKKVTNVTKSNAFKDSLVFWDKVVEEVGADFPEVEYEMLYVDAAAMNFVKRPERFDVILTTNLFGDILSDLGGMIMGGIGLGPSGNINPERAFPSMFEPIHGSAPKYAGTGIANPIGSIWAGSLMLEHLGQERGARLMVEAIKDTVKGDVKPREIGGTASTSEVGDAVAEAVRRLASSVR